MPAFFTGWPLWEKMTFVLALAIVAAIFLGLCKNMYSRWKLRSYSTVEQKQQAPTPNMVEAQTITADDVPFGIRALERGVEVEGVWISRTNTPVPSTPGSPASSFMMSGASTPSLATDPFSLPESSMMGSEAFQAVHSSGRTSWSNQRLPSPSLGPVGPREGAGVESMSSHSQTVTSGRSRPTSRNFSSHLRNSTTNKSSDSSSSSSRPPLRISAGSSEDPSTYQRSSSSERTASRNSSSSSDRSRRINTQFSNLEESEDRLHPMMQSGKGKARIVDSRADLGLLQSHRLSHVAETGQLAPRTRRPGGLSGDWSSGAASQSTSLEPQVDSYFAKPRSAPSPPPVAVRNPFETPVATPTDMLNGDVSTPEVSTVDSKKQGMGTQNGYRSMSSSRYLERPEPVHSASFFQSDRNSQILRTVNSGFEVLKPGTLGAAPAELTSFPESTPEENRRNSRKLHKKRPSNDRKRSSFIEIIYGNERHPQ